MLKRVSCAAVIVVAVLAIGASVRAESPMTPLRPTAPQGAPLSRPPGAPPSAQPKIAQPWVEPPAASTPKPPPSAAENAAPGAQPEQSARPLRTPRPGRRLARARGWSTRQLNYQQQFYGGWSGASMPYNRGYGPAPYSNSGD